MVNIHNEPSLGFQIYWNESCTFNVWQMFCDGPDERPSMTEVDCFTTMEPPSRERAKELALNYCKNIHDELMENL